MAGAVAPQRRAAGQRRSSPSSPAPAPPPPPVSWSRSWPIVRAALADRVAGAQRVGAPHRHLAGHAAGRCRPGGGRGGSPCRRTDSTTDGRPLRRRRRRRRRRRSPPARSTAGGIGRLAGRLDEQLRQPRRAGAVGDGVVDLPQRRGAPTLQPVDDVHRPQRPGPVVGVLVDPRDGVEQLAHRARRRQGDDAQVLVEVELGVGPPHRRAVATEAADDVLHQARHGDDGGRQLGAEVLDVGHAVEDRDRRRRSG